MITVFGATGFTGRLVARALTRADLPFRIAGRSAEKLADLSANLPGRPKWVVADAAQPATLPALFQDTHMLVNLVGPFTDLGDKVIAQAAMRGVHYLDVTNELGYVFRARGYHEMALHSGAALVPACGFEVALADCAAHLTGSRLHSSSPNDPLDEVNIVYNLKGQGASRGTRLSAVRSLATSWLAYRDGKWTGQVPGGQVKQFRWPGQDHYALNFPSCESVTIPAHLLTRRVEVWMANIRGARYWARVGIPLFARLSRSILRGAILKMAGLGVLPAAGALDGGQLRGDSPFNIYVEARRAGEHTWMALQGQDPYGTTAEIVAYAARCMTAPDYRRSGFLAPALALEPQDFLDYAQSSWGLKIQS
jgi:short subunit dehydrogenase-like uncharacterized protein